MENYTPEQLLEILENTVCKCKLGGVSMILRALITGNVTTPVGSRLQIFKHPQNDNLAVLEVNDMVEGYATDNKFVKAIYTGGDATNWANFNILEEIDNIELN